MVKVTPQQFVEKWSKRLKGATQEMKDGADRVTVSPGKSANDKIDLMLEKLIEAFESGRVSRGLLGFTVEEWRTAFKEKGMKNIGAGIEGAKAKQLKFAEWLIPTVKAGQDLVNVMDEGTLDDSIARMEKFIRHMASKKYK